MILAYRGYPIDEEFRALEAIESGRANTVAASVLAELRAGYYLAPKGYAITGNGSRRIDAGRRYLRRLAMIPPLPDVPAADRVSGFPQSCIIRPRAGADAVVHFPALSLGFVGSSVANGPQPGDIATIVEARRARSTKEQDSYTVLATNLFSQPSVVTCVTADHFCFVTPRSSIWQQWLHRVMGEQQDEHFAKMAQIKAAQDAVAAKEAYRIYRGPVRCPCCGDMRLVKTGDASTNGILDPSGTAFVCRDCFDLVNKHTSGVFSGVIFRHSRRQGGAIGF